MKLNWKYGPRREGDIEKIWGDCTKANKVLGWKAEAKLEDVLASAWNGSRNFALMASCKVLVVLEIM